MTVLWWILGTLGVLVLLFILLCFLWVSVRADLSAETQVVHVKIGPVRFRIYPAKQKEKKSMKNSMQTF